MASKKEETQPKTKQDAKSKEDIKAMQEDSSKNDTKSTKTANAKQEGKPKKETKTKQPAKAKKAGASKKNNKSTQAEETNIDDLVIATDFLVTAKAAVRNLAVAITETATPSVKKVLRSELDTAIETHDKIAQYMIKNEMYHAYDIDEQVEHDLEKAKTALKTAKM